MGNEVERRWDPKVVTTAEEHVDLQKRNLKESVYDQEAGSIEEESLWSLLLKSAEILLHFSCCDKGCMVDDLLVAS